MYLIQCLLISLITCFTGSGTAPIGGVLAKYLFQRPFIGGLICGLILGDVSKGVAIGVAMQLVYIGYFNVGGVSSIDLGMISFPCVALAIVADIDTATAVTLATGIGTLYNSFVILCRNVFFVATGELMKKGCEEGNERKIFWGYDGWVSLVTLLKRGLPSFLLLYFGADAVNTLVNSIPTSLLDAISKVGGFLPCIGMAALLVYLANDKFGLVIFAIGFASYGYLGLTSTSIILFALGFAYLIYRSSGTRQVVVAEGNDSDEEDEIL